MRVTTWFLLLVAGLCFVMAGIKAVGNARPDDSGATAPGRVTALLDGPHHALVEVTPRNGSAFSFPANTEAGLKLGQHITVRYEPDQPLATAEVTTSQAPSSVWSLIAMGLAFLAGALLSPVFVRWFPNLLGFRIRF